VPEVAGLGRIDPLAHVSEIVGLVRAGVTIGVQGCRQSVVPADRRRGQDVGLQGADPLPLLVTAEPRRHDQV